MTARPSMRRLFAALIWSLVVAAGCGDGAGARAFPPETLRVLTYNIHHGVGMDDRLDLDRIARVIDGVQPDVVALQEVDVGAARTDAVDQAAVLGARTGLAARFGPFMSFEGGEYGMAMLSRWEIVSARNLALPGACRDCPCNPVPCPEARTALTVVVRSRATGRQVVVSGVHFYATEQERLEQAQAATAALAGETDPVVLTGDFNSERGTPVMAALARDWSILDKQSAPLTFPALVPDREIDFVLVRPDAGLTVTRHLVLDDAVVPMASVASDHRPVLAEFMLPAAAR